eukprot:Skav234182  [mRNA]  locus=scaffold1377:129480:138209:- [translate_table: standard]
MPVFQQDRTGPRIATDRRRVEQQIVEDRLLKKEKESRSQSSELGKRQSVGSELKRRKKFEDELEAQEEMDQKNAAPALELVPGGSCRSVGLYRNLLNGGLASSRGGEKVREVKPAREDLEDVPMKEEVKEEAKEKREEKALSAKERYLLRKKDAELVKIPKKNRRCSHNSDTAVHAEQLGLKGTLPRLIGRPDRSPQPRISCHGLCWRQNLLNRSGAPAVPSVVWFVVLDGNVD